MPRVLVVDDDVDTVEVLAAILEDEGYEVESVGDGVAAFVRLTFGPKPDAILLDLWMPVVDGAEVLAEIRRDPGVSTVPIVVLTAAPVPGGVAHGADAVLAKPFDVPRLLDVLAGLVRRGPSQLPA